MQELSSKDQEKVAEVSRVRVELQEQIGHLNAERTAQGGLKEKITALEREIKGVRLKVFPFQKMYDSTSQFPLSLCNLQIKLTYFPKEGSQRFLCDR